MDENELKNILISCVLTIIGIPAVIFCTVKIVNWIDRRLEEKDNQRKRMLEQRKEEERDKKRQRLEGSIVTKDALWETLGVSDGDNCAERQFPCHYISLLSKYIIFPIWREKANCLKYSDALA